MSKKVKALIQGELKSRFEGVNECLVVSLRGLNGKESNEMRGDLLDKQIQVSVVKNSLARRAFGELGAEAMGVLLTGPCAIAHGGDSIVDVAKVMMDWSKKLDKLEIKGGYLDGQALDASQAKDLSKMLSRSELQGAVVALAQSPGARVAGAITGPAGYLAGCIKSLVEKLEEAQAA
jgi:large subunit ribosomal protein L10